MGNDKKYFFKMITSIFSLILTFILVFIVSYAWYTSNQIVTSNGIEINVSDNNIVESIKYYKVNSISKSGSELSVTKGEEFVAETDILMPEYDSLANTIQEIIVEISFSEAINLSRFSVISTSTEYLGSDNVELGTSNNSLSSVIKFYTSTSISDNTISFTEENSESFVTGISDDNPVFKNRIELGSLGSTNLIYVLLSYNKDSIEYIYSKNIGNEVFENANISYNCDFSFMLFGGDN